jgi:hypothetical protein
VYANLRLTAAPGDTNAAAGGGGGAASMMLNVRGERTAPLHMASSEGLLLLRRMLDRGVGGFLDDVGGVELEASGMLFRFLP